jgi:hypothetical protein
MSEKIRCGNTIGIDLNQVLAWNRIPTYRGGVHDQLFEIEEWDLKLHISGSTITIRKSLPGQVKLIKDSSEDVILGEEDFNKLFQCLVEKFSRDISEDSNLLAQAFGK